MCRGPIRAGRREYLSDSLAEVANSYEYDAYGVARQAHESAPYRYRFVGAALNGDAGLYWVGSVGEYAPESGGLLSSSLGNMRQVGSTDSDQGVISRPPPPDPERPPEFYVAWNAHTSLCCMIAEVGPAMAKALLQYNFQEDKNMEPFVELPEVLQQAYDDCTVEKCCKVWKDEICMLQAGTCVHGVLFVWGTYTCNFRGEQHVRKLRFSFDAVPGRDCPKYTTLPMYEKSVTEKVDCRDVSTLMKDPKRTISWPCG